LRGEQATGLHLQAQRLGQHAGQTLQRGACGRCQFRIGMRHHPARAQQQRLQFIGRKHHRRQQEARSQLVADAGVAGDLGALPAQRVDIPVQGAQADLQSLRQLGAAHRRAAAPQFIQQMQQAGGALGHGYSGKSASGAADTDYRAERYSGSCAHGR